MQHWNNVLRTFLKYDEVQTTARNHQNNFKTKEKYDQKDFYTSPMMDLEGGDGN